MFLSGKNLDSCVWNRFPFVSRSWCVCFSPCARELISNSSLCLHASVCWFKHNKVCSHIIMNRAKKLKKIADVRVECCVRERRWKVWTCTRNDEYGECVCIFSVIKCWTVESLKRRKFNCGNMYWIHVELWGGGTDRNPEKKRARVYT